MSLNQPLFKLSGLFFFVTINLSSLFAQELNLAQFYNSSEPHNSLLASSSDRLDSLYTTYLREHNIKEDNGAYQDFIYDYNFFIEKLNKSGRVFSGDEITTYLNGLKDEILADHPKKDFIQVYTTNFDQLNAFTNDFGSIYVNVALVAKIDSEMKLRVILAHEIAHVLMRHSFKMANLDNHFSNDKFERINQISDFDSHKFSRTQELEADSIAYQLLKEQGYDISNLEGLFENLKTSRNPVFSEHIDLRELCLTGNSIQMNYLNSVQRVSKQERLFSMLAIEVDDSLSTHPSAEVRKNLYQRMYEQLSDSLQKEVIPENQKFEHCRLLASHVLSKTLMTEHRYGEALYLVIQLRKQYPDDQSLLKQFVKLQLLIAQSKYMFNETSILNSQGSSCSDTSYMVFKRGLLSIPPMEMNILCIENIIAAKKISNDVYLNRLLDVSYQFLYKYNPKLISKVNGELQLTSEEVLDVVQSKRPLLTSDQKKNYIEIEKDGYIIIDSLIMSKEVIDDFVWNFNDYEQFKKSLHTFRASRDMFEKMLTIDEFIVDYDPDESYRKFRKGKSNSVRPIPDSAITALVQTDTYVFTRTKMGPEIDTKKTLEVQEIIAELLQDEDYFKKDLTNLNQESGTTSIRDNYIHYLLTNWIGECLNFEDLVYSVADEEILKYLGSVKTEYLVYNFNILNKTKSNSKYRCLYYNLYFDLNTMGVAYVSTIASSKKPKKKYLKHYFYQAHMGKSSL